MFDLQDFFELAGSLICHQLPSRTLSSGSMLLPVCARDTGIYLGVFTGAMFLLLMRRLKAQKPPETPTAIFMCLLMLPMVLDGLLSYTGFISTNNTTRLFTGALFGLPIPFFLVPAARFNIYGANERPVLKHPAELVPVYLFLLVLCGLYLNGLMPYTAAGIIFLSGLLFLLSRISYTVLARVVCLKPFPLYTAAFGTTICVLALLYMISAYILQPIKTILLGS